MKKNSIVYTLVSLLALGVCLVTSCKDRKTDHEIQRYDSIPEDESRLNPDPLDETQPPNSEIDQQQSTDHSNLPTDGDTLSGVTESTRY